MSIKPRDLLLPLLLVSVVATGVSSVSSLGNIARWLVLAALGGYLVINRGSKRIAPTVVAALTIYVGWCLLTITWSQVPSLSLMKGLALVLAVTAAFGGGYHWITHHRVERGLDFILPYALLSLLAGLSGDRGSTTGTGVELFSGATSGANFLGFVVATSMPIILWRLYRGWKDVRRRALWSVVACAYLFVLYLTASRSSYLILAVVIAGLLIALGIRRLALAGFAVLVVLVLVASAASELRTAFLLRNVYKWSADDIEGGIFNSRQNPWNESYDAAVEGGWLGVGYGVSAGVGGDFAGKVSAVGYGREKGNSQLATIEETGLVGLGLCVILFAVLIRRLVGGFRAARSLDLRVMLGLILGTLIGILVQSAFEAWWGAPGSPEFVIFWVLAGAGLGLTRVARAQKVMRAKPLVPAKA